MKRCLKLCLAVIASGGLMLGNAVAQPNDWSQWRPLLGKWKASGAGKPGEGAGEFSFTLELQDRVVVRKSHTDYPASSDRPAFAHDDLMILTRTNEGKVRADYFDNEGHVIRYSGDVSQDGKVLTFTSDTTPGQPAFRLTYTLAGAGEMKIRFEIAPPGKPGEFKTYVEGTARKS